MREKCKDAQLDVFEGEKFNYRCILTNDHKSTEKELIEYYNQRGSSEKIFDIQNNDFGTKNFGYKKMLKNAASHFFLGCGFKVITKLFVYVKA